MLSLVVVIRTGNARGAEGKRPIPEAVEHRDDHQAGFIAMEPVDTVDSTTVSRF